MRHPASVEALCRQLLETLPRLDFIINNACQTVRRPPEFYAHMMEGERAALHDMPSSVRQLLGAGGQSGDMPHQSTWLAVAQNGFTQAAELSQVPLLAEDLPRAEASIPGRASRPKSATGRLAGTKLVAPADGRSVVSGIARSPVDQRRRRLSLSTRASSH